MANMENQTADALKWLFEMEAVDSPVLRANLYENVYLADRGIVDCAVWITPTFTYQKGILIWVKLGWKAKMFNKDTSFARIKEVVNNLLPSYDIRIVEDMNILELAQKKIEEVYGGMNETDTNNVTDSDNESGESQRTEENVQMPEESDILPDSKELTEDKPEVRNEVKQCDPQSEQKAQDLIEDIYSDSKTGINVQAKL